MFDVRDLVLSAAVCLLLVSANARALVTISIKDQAVVESLDVRIGDLADVTADNQAERAAIEHVYVGRAPRVGVTGTISEAALAAALRSQVGDSAFSVTWSGSKDVKVTTASHEFDARDIVKDAKSRLLDQLLQRFGNGVVEEENSLDPIMLPKGRVSVAVRPIPTNVALSSHMTVWADIDVDGAPYRVMAMHFRLSATEPRALTAKAVGKGEPVSESSVVIQDEDALSVCAQAADGSTQRRFEGSFDPGHVICDRDVSATPAVKRGEHVVLRTGSGGIEIQESVVILEDAAIGSKVRVVPEHGHAELVAQVVSSGVVRLFR